ncbi:3-oxoacyl-[acyl-carrier protein] reductase [Catenuloplanes nepalensis]|uniref:3-oxoacyl-[acyl-carrier protein] reductase n=1 Tax=Catenuloplanes nepalensis TaxID=587533 RepID=A0ABT9N3W5_9ACTN|nr:3-oxoacyl-ACP reductase [Catenuloplanes nepalensis]MDP9798356.1 3-oxoacyl-[acyl-carrier protein] reductase [Catenuloplanes nepalensis]
MVDRYATFANSAAGKALVKRLGLPAPTPLRRHSPGDPLVTGPVLVDAAPGGRLAPIVRELLDEAGVTLRDPVAAAVEAGASATPGRLAALIFDATGVTSSDQLRTLYDFFHAQARTLLPSGRVIVLGTAPEDCAAPREAIAQRALEGLVRSIGKEFGRGSTAQLVYAAPDAPLTSTLRFLLSGRSAYVSGQVIRIGPGSPGSDVDWDRPLEGKVALVTGAARGIGAAIARVLARDGARVIALDVPAAGEPLAALANEIRGEALQLDVTAADAPDRLAGCLRDRHGRVDVVVHNAGITRDRTLGRMSAEQWDSVLDVNLSSQERINDAILELLPAGGRLIQVSSMNGIAGNRGQANYATSKAGVIGLVQVLAPALAARGVTVNAVAPGFIETPMTARMPAGLREASRRLNSLSQGGLPIDVAETIAWFASPGSSGVTGNVVRVCGQSLIGA